MLRQGEGKEREEIMNRDEARKAAEVMLAYADGKEVEWSPKDRDGRWIRANSPEFDWGSNDYRIKPQPKYRPFNSAEECWQEMQKHQPFGWLKDNVEGHYYTNITAIDNGEENCSIGANFGWNLEGIFKNYIFADGEPFGVKEEGV